jgi:L-ascorbate metabolism protein UlaG (beta-lactamase superfamily)
MLLTRRPPHEPRSSRRKEAPSEFPENDQSLLTSAATVKGVNARNYIWEKSLPALLLAFATMTSAARAQDAQFTSILRLTNRETALRFNAPAGVKYRIDVATNLPSTTNDMSWLSLLTLQSVGVNQHTDSAAPFLSARYYRAAQVTNAEALTGDHLSTTNGDLVIHPLYHASLVMTWNGKVIYSDPDDDPDYESRYAGLPQGDLILITHEHGDHYSPAKLDALRKSSGVIIVPQRVYNMGSFAAFRPSAFVLSYGQSTNVDGINVLAVAGYNDRHAYTTNNCYVLTLGGRRIFISGDTGNTPEIRALTDIDVAFLSMNMPFTMNAASATNVIRAMRPKVVYPYHYSESGGSVTTNAATFKQWLGTDLGIEVRLRAWY